MLGIFQPGLNFERIALNRRRRCRPVPGNATQDIEFKE
jgi:hypothetical protein